MPTMAEAGNSNKVFWVIPDELAHRLSMEVAEYDTSHGLKVPIEEHAKVIAQAIRVSGEIAGKAQELMGSKGRSILALNIALAMIAKFTSLEADVICADFARAVAITNVLEGFFEEFGSIIRVEDGLKS